jgi:hypothetical protein
VPDRKRQGECAKPIGKHGRLAAMNLPALPDGRGGGQQHHNASNLVHARILSAAFVHAAAIESILTNCSRRA